MMIVDFEFHLVALGWRALQKALHRNDQGDR
jgi:hypothetical protein